MHGKAPLFALFSVFVLLTSCFAVSSSEVVSPVSLQSRCVLPFKSFSLQTSFVSNRLSSLTIGDSERRSSSAQQKDPSADLPAESAGIFESLFLMVNALLNGADG